jgi:PAS domain S-box-containing protein
MALYHFILYLLRPTDRAPLHFALCCLLMAVRLLTTGERYLTVLLPSLDWLWLLRLEYLSFYLALPAFTLFFRDIFQEQIAPQCVPATIALAAVFSLSVLFLPAALFTWTVTPYQLVTVGFCLYGVAVMGLAVFSRKEGALVLLTGFTVFFLTIVNDILYTNMIIFTAHLVPAGLFALILSQAALLALRFTRSFATVASQSQALARSNRAIQREVGERRRAEKQLQKSQDRLSMALDVSDAGVWELQPESGTVKIDHAFMEKLGYATGSRSFDLERIVRLSPEKNRIKIQAELEALLQGKQETYEMVHVVRSPSGNLRWVHTRGRVVERDPEEKSPRLIIGTVLDITERRKAKEKQEALENRLRQARKMESLGTLAGGIAHDFNNILGAIIGFAQLAQVDAEENRLIEKHVGQILKASERARGMIQQILTFSRRKAFRIVPCDFESILQETLALIRASFPATIEIRTHTDPGTFVVLADATQIHQVLMNLFTNALHAMEATGGTLTVSMDTCEVQKEGVSGWNESMEKGRYLRLAVGDTGCGMNAETLANLFDPYFTTKDTGKGTGMGMATVHGIVRGHRGAITVESREGAGTVFTLYLPLSTAGPPAPLPDEMPVRSDNREWILFVDDEEVLLEMGQKMLEHLGYRIDIHNDPRKALQAFQAAPGRYDLVITDMTMPHLSGEALTLAIRRIRPAMPVILCTGYNKSMNRERALALGASAFVEKPFSMGRIAAVIHQALSAAHSGGEPGTAPHEKGA